MNLLHDYPEVRKWLYFFQWVVNGIAAVLGAYFAAAGYSLDSLPKWYVIAIAVAPVLWTYLGLQAGANVPVSGGPPPPNPEHGYTVLGALGLGLIVLTVILLVLTLLNVVAVDILVLVVLFVVGLVLLLIGGGTGNLRV